MKKTNLHGAEFLLGARDRRQFPPDCGLEVAFAGRSNAGKSSAMNVLTGSRRLARVSKVPGRTREINFFRLDERRRLVDLPGYGYAEVPETLRQQWTRTMEDYLLRRQSLRGVVLVVDARHAFTAADLRFLDWLAPRRLPLHILLTKADKLGQASARDHLARAVLAAARLDGPITLQLFSATHRLGIDEARRHIGEWMEQVEIA
jgi:GTP-binding protein